MPTKSEPSRKKKMPLKVQDMKTKKNPEGGAKHHPKGGKIHIHDISIKKPIDVASPSLLG